MIKQLQPAQQTVLCMVYVNRHQQIVMAAGMLQTPPSADLQGKGHNPWPGKGILMSIRLQLWQSYVTIYCRNLEAPITTGRFTFVSGPTNQNAGSF